MRGQSPVSRFSAKNMRFSAMHLKDFFCSSDVSLLRVFRSQIKRFGLAESVSPLTCYHFLVHQESNDTAAALPDAGIVGSCCSHQRCSAAASNTFGAPTTHSKAFGAVEVIYTSETRLLALLRQ